MESKKIFKRLVSAALSVTTASQLFMAALPASVFAISLNTDYLIYSDEDITINTNKAVLNGDVFTGDDFSYLGNDTCYVNKTLNADKTSGKLAVKETVDVRTKKPDYTSQLQNGVNYKRIFHEDSALIDTQEYDLHESVLAKGKLRINRTAFKGRGYIRAKDDIIYNAVQNDENSEIFIYSENGDIDLQGTDLTVNGIIYAPNGTVELNAKNLTLNGVIVAKNVEFNGTNLTLNEIKDKSTSLIQFGPQLDIKGISEEYKENRLISLDITESFGIDDIDTDSLVWTFTSEDYKNSDCIKIDEKTSTNLKKNLIITKKGTYRVNITGKDKDGNEIKYYDIIEVREDIAPVASFWKSSDKAVRNADGNSVIELEDTSYSLDGDNIGSRVWSVFFDSDNDGDFSDEKEEIFNAGNETKVTYEAKSVGNYRFKLSVAEYFDDTIPEFITEDVYKVANTSGMKASATDIEVLNTAPESYSGISKAKNVDIVVTVGNADVDDIDTLNKNIKNVKADLESKGYSVNLSTVSTSTLTAKDTFAWDEYDHYNYRDSYLPTLDKHILFEEDSIKMVGYSVAPLRDWLFVDDKMQAKRILSFDMIRDKTDWHSMEGGGFLFNTNIRDEVQSADDPEAEPVTKKIMDGYCIILTQGGFKLVQLTNIDVEAFRNGGVSSSVQSAGKVLTSVPVQNSYDSYNVKIVASNRVISVFINDDPVIDNFVLPDTSTGTGFGPIICHGNHGCGQQSYFTFSNIKMTTVNGSELSDVLDKFKWRDSAEHYVLNLSKQKVFDLANEESVGSAVKSLIEKKTNFLGLGTSDSKEQYDLLLRSADGVYMDWYDLLKNETTLKNYILSDLEGIDYSIKNNRVNTSDEIVYNDYFVDKENDPVGTQLWEYDLDSSVYENSSRKSGLFTTKKPIETFEATGKYKIKSKLRDDPTNGNNALDPYKKWSNEVKWTDELYVHSLPVANVESEIFATEDPNKFFVKLKFSAEDKDGLSHKNKGITKEKFEWKTVDDSEWHDGKLPSTIEPEKTYLQKYMVCDEQGEWSKPCIHIVFAEKKINTDMFEDNEAPELKLTVSDENPCLGDEIIISASAKDNTEIAYVKTTVNGKAVAEYQGSVIYKCDKEGEFTVVSECSDIGGNITTETKKFIVTDRRDLTAPQIEVDTKDGITLDGKKLTITGSVYDENELDSFTVEYAADGSETYKKIASSKTAVKNGTIASVELPGEGKYIFVITAKDKTGNKATNTITVTYEEKTISEPVVEENTEVPTTPPHLDTPAQIKITPSKEKIEVGEVVIVKAEASDKDGLVAVKVYKDDKLIAEAPVEFRFSEAEAKIVNIKVVTTDSYGAETEKTQQIIVEDNRDKIMPTAEITSPAPGSNISGKVTVKGSAFDETGLRMYTLEYKKSTDKSFKNICTSYKAQKNAALGVWDTYALDNGVYDLRLSVTDNGGNCQSVTAQFAVENGKTVTEDDLTNDLIVITKPDSKIAADNVIKIEAKVDPSLKGKEYEITVKGKGDATIVKHGTIADDGSISASVDSSMYPDGTYTVTAAVKNTDQEGNDTSVKKEAKVVVKHDLTNVNGKYECKITSPADLTDLSCKTDIHAKVGEYVFKKYKFEYSPASKEQYTIFSSGDVRGNTDIVGAFDTTLLENGFYDIRFTAYGDGITAQDTITVGVEGNLKVGNFSVSFEDIETEQNGIPLSVSSVYDSRTRTKSDSFGYGWGVDYNSVKLSISADQSKYWETSTAGSSFITRYCLEETRKHRIRIDLGNGETEEFAMKISPENQAFYPLQYGISAYYVSTTGSSSKLVPYGMSANDLIYNGGVLFNDNLNEYDPHTFIYIRADGSQHIIDADKGLIRSTSAEGDVVTYGENGITCSGKQVITFKHDSEGRITNISTLSGKSVSYEYDIFGDLTAVTDVSGYKRTFKYSKHYLTDIYTSNGTRAARNEYDDDGRLVKTIDADGNSITYEHDIDGREETVKDRNGGVTRYIYDNSGNILSQTDPMGNTVKFTYDANGNMSSRTDALNNTTKYQYDKNGKLLEIENAEGIITKNTYNSNGNLSKISINGIDTQSYSYDSKGRLIGRTDANGNTTEYGYMSGEIESITDEIGSYVNISYNSAGKPSQAETGDGTVCSYVYDNDGKCISKTITYTSDGEQRTNTISYTYDAAGRVISTVDTDGNAFTTEYNAAGKPVLETDKKGGQTKYAYDKLGNLSKVTYPDGTTESFTYDKNGNKLTATDRAGRTATMTYDKAGNLLSKAYKDGTTQTYKYDAAYNLIEQTAANGGATKYEYDKIGRNTAVIDAAGNRTEYTYDSLSRKESRKDAKGNVYKYTYDNNGNLIKTTYPDGTSNSSKYNARGLVTERTDANGYKTSYAYDNMNRLISVTDAMGGKTSYKYDNGGSLLSQTDANGNSTSYTYDAQGRLISAKNAMGQTAEYAYDKLGNIISYSDFGGKKTTFSYDRYGKLTSKKSGNETTGYAYDREGKLISVSDRAGRVTYTYDNILGLTKVSYPNNRYIEYGYDEFGRLTSVKTESGETSYAYDKLDRIIKVTDKNGNATSYTYDKNGNRSSVKYANGIKVAYTYDKLNRPIKEVVSDKSGSTIASYEYTIGKAGEITHIKESDRDIFYTYDKLYRLLSEESISDKASDDVYKYTYTYDKAGNRTSKTVNGKKTTYTYNALSQLTSGGGVTYLYDNSGNLISEEAGKLVKTYKYDSDNKLIEADVNGVTEEYQYDYSGNRLSKKSGEEYTYYLNDISGGISQVLAEYDNNGTAKCIYTRGNDLVSQERDGVVSYYISDVHGNVRMLTDASGKITDRYSYDAWGNLLSSEGKTENSHYYCGEQFDTLTNTYYLRARYMDPATGRFNSLDTYQGSRSNPLTLNKYLYANGNPVMNSDPTGHFSLLGCVLGVGISYVINQLLSSALNFGMNALFQNCFSNVNNSVSDGGTKSSQSIDNRNATFEELFNFNNFIITVNIELNCLAMMMSAFKFYKSQASNDYEDFGESVKGLLEGAKDLGDAMNARYELYDYIFDYAMDTDGYMDRLKDTTDENISNLTDTIGGFISVPSLFENDELNKWFGKGMDLYDLFCDGKDQLDKMMSHEEYTASDIFDGMQFLEAIICF